MPTVAKLLWKSRAVSVFSEQFTQSHQVITAALGVHRGQKFGGDIAERHSSIGFYFLSVILQIYNLFEP